MDIRPVNLKEIEIALNGAAEDVSDFRKVARPASDIVYSTLRTQFSTKKGWEPRAQSTIDRLTAKNRRGFSSVNETLRDSDSMFKALTTRGAPFGIYEPSEDGLVMGTDLPYARRHQFGKGVVARPIYNLDDIGDALQRELPKAYRGLFEDRGFDFVDRGEIPF